MPDETLIRFYLNGNPNATLVELYKDRVYRSIYNIMQDKYAAEENMIKVQSNEKLMQLVCLLPEHQREIIILRHFADLKFREISNVLNCSVNTALGRMRYALLNLRKLIEEKQIAL